MLKEKRNIEKITFAEYLDETAQRFSPAIVAAQILIVPLHIFTTDLIDTNISLSPISIGLRLAASASFIVLFLLIRFLKGPYSLYFGLSFFINAISDIYLASISSEVFLVTHLLGLAIVFIAYGAVIAWYPMVYHFVLVISIVATVMLFSLNSNVSLFTFLREGGGFLMFLVIISSVFNLTGYNTLKIGFDKNNKIRYKNKQLEKTVKELATSQENLKQEKQNLEETLAQLSTTQSQLIKAERMASVGKMTDGIAHEINNPLNFVSGGVQGLNASMPEIELALKICRDLKLEEGAIQEHKIVELLAELKEAGDLDELIEDIQYLFKDIVSGVERISSVVKGLQLFTRIGEKEQVQGDIHEIIELALISIKKKDHIVVKKEFDHTINSMMCYPGQLSQAIANIISNAVDAITKKGEILIQTQQEEKYIRVSITDDGIGMSENVLLKAFEPFFSEKKLDKGIGLGLSVTHGIIEKHLGNIEINSILGEGTTVTVLLPTDAS